MVQVDNGKAATRVGGNRTHGLELVVFRWNDIQTYPLPEHGCISVGRSERNVIRVDHPSVSRRHAQLIVGPQLVIEDLGSANGTFVGGGCARENLLQTQSMRRLTGSSARVAIGESILLGEVTALVRRVESLPAALGELSDEQAPARGVVLCDPAMRSVYAEAERAAQASISILILGETGVGKDLLARAIHSRSRRANGPFKGINCATLSGSLLEGELFGYERGAFTGAVQARAGVLEAADHGSLFLDEIGELEPAAQAKLLRVLEERAVLRLGSRQPRPLDVRFLAATNRDLDADVAGGRFRSDLFFRLAGLCLTIPPLRERPGEIEPLLRTFLTTAAKQLERSTAVDISPEALGLLRAYSWPGNVRELKNVVERALILCDERSISPAHLPARLVRAAAQGRSPSQPPVPAALSLANAGDALALRADLKALERSRLLEALERCEGNQTRAAQLMGISRRTFVSRLREYGMTRARRAGVP